MTQPEAGPPSTASSTSPTSPTSPGFPPAAPQKGHSGWRAVCAGLAFLLAALLTIPAVVAFWGNRTLINTKSYVSTVAPLAADAQVQEVIANQVSGIVADSIDINNIVAETLGPDLANSAVTRRLTQRLQEAIPGLAYQLTAELLASPRFPAIWEGLNRTAHDAVIKILTSDGGGVTEIVDGKLVVDLSAPVAAVQQELVQRGIPQAAIRPVPADRTQFALMDAEKLQQARTIYRFASPITAWLIVVVGVLYLLAWVLANRRRRMLGIIGLTLLLSGAVLGLGLTAGRAVFEDALASTFLADASAVFYTTLLRNLQTAWIVMAVAGGLLLAVAVATRSRRQPGVVTAG